MKLGQPVPFVMDVYLATAGMVANSDELEFAKEMLKRVPAFYRDHPTLNLIKMRDDLDKQTWTAAQYKGIYDGTQITEEHTAAYWPLRARLVEEQVKLLNDKGVKPNIMEYAPGSLWLAYGLRHKGLSFTYEHISLDHVKDDFERPVNPEFNIFCAFEIIEHLSDETDIYKNYLKFNKRADLVFISTPLYTFAGGMDDWENRPLGHLRTYTPKELVRVVSEMFHGYEWGVAHDNTIVLMGKR